MAQGTATVIAYPIDGNSLANSPSRMLMDPNNLDSSFLSLGLGPSSYGEETADLGGNFFSQLDSMIQAVKVESTALDSMRDKLKEVENLRTQISAFTKRLIDADQANLNLKTNLMKSQEAFTELKKQKAEVESNMVPVRQELNRTKDALNKERMGRQQMQQEIMMLRDQCARLEQQRDVLERDAKSIPALTESNEILKSDLSQLRKRFKDEKIAMQKHIKQLEGQSRDAEQIKAEVRQLAVRMMELSAGGSTTVVPTGGGGMQSNMPPSQNSSAMMMQQQQQQQNVSMSYSSANANTYGNAVHQSMNSFSSQYQYDFDEEDEEDELMNQDSDYDTNGYIDDLAIPMVGSSMESMGMMNNNSMNTARGAGGGGGGGGGASNPSVKKKKVKKRVVQSNTTGSNHTLNTSSSSPMINRANTMTVMQSFPTGRSNTDSFNLPRIH